MESLNQLLPGAVAALVRDVPLSKGKIAFAWRTAVGPSMDRATVIALAHGGVLEVRVTDQHWHREIRRSAPLLLERLAAMLGAGTITRLLVINEGPEEARR